MIATEVADQLGGLVQRLRSDGGFTVIELMVVVLIIGVLATMAAGSYWFTTSRTYAVTCRSNRATFESAVSMFRAEHEQVGPLVIDDLAPYVQNFDHSVKCPEDPNVRLELDTATMSVVCPNHPD